MLIFGTAVSLLDVLSFITKCCVLWWNLPSTHHFCTVDACLSVVSQYSHFCYLLSQSLATCAVILYTSVVRVTYLLHCIAGATCVTDGNTITEQRRGTVQSAELSWTKAVCIVGGFHGRLWQVGEWDASRQTESCKWNFVGDHLTWRLLTVPWIRCSSDNCHTNVIAHELK